MSKQLVDGQERFDGFGVTVYEGAFTGKFDMDGEGVDIQYGDTVSFVVHCKVDGADFGETKHGDIKRTNKFKVTAAVALTDQQAEEVGRKYLPAALLGAATLPGQRTIDEAIVDTLPDDLPERVEEEAQRSYSGAPSKDFEDSFTPGVQRTGVGTNDPALKSFLEGPAPR